MCLFCRISAIVETGFLERWKHLHWPKDRTCEKVMPTSMGHTSVSFQDMTGAYLILGVGLVAALAVFLQEIICQKKQKMSTILCQVKVWVKKTVLHARWTFLSCGVFLLFLHRSLARPVSCLAKFFGDVGYRNLWPMFFLVCFSSGIVLSANYLLYFPTRAHCVDTGLYQVNSEVVKVVLSDIKRESTENVPPVYI